MKKEESSNQRAASPPIYRRLLMPNTPTQVIQLDSMLNSESVRNVRDPDSPAFPGSEVLFREHPPCFEQKIHSVNGKRGIQFQSKLVSDQDKRGMILFEKRQQRALIEDYPLLEKKGIDEIRKVYGKDAKLPVTPTEPGQQVVYVNALQYTAFCRFRVKKQRRKQRLIQKYGTYQLYKQNSKTYMHESRHKHAKNRVRDKNGRFISKQNQPPATTTPDALLKMLSRQESETDHLDILNRMPDID